MLSDDPIKVLDEVKAAITFRQDHTKLSEDLIARYATKRFRSGFGRNPGTQNYEFEWVTNMVPNLVHQNPAFGVDMPGVPDDHPAVLALKMGLNGWAQQTHLSTQLREIAVDLQFNFGVALVTLETIGDYNAGTPIDGDLAAAANSAPPVRPRLHRISPRRFFCDPQAMGRRQGRFFGHVWIEDREDLLNAKLPSGKAKFDKAEVEKLSDDAGVKQLLMELGIPTGQLLERNQVVGFEVYVPERGMIYTLAANANNAATFLRKPRRYLGPATGPYVLFGLHIVPDQVYPLPPLAVTASLVDEINAHAMQVSADAGSAKRLIAVDADPKVQQTITTAANGTVVCVPGLAGKVFPLELGGPQAANLNYIAMLREAADRTLGHSESVRGNITGATAREVDNVQANRNRRVVYSRGEFQADVARAATIAAYHMWHNAHVRFPLTYTDPTTGEKEFKEFRGGATEDERRMFGGMMIRVEPMSMEAVDEQMQQARVEKLTADIAAMMPAMVQEPWGKWKAIIDDRGESLGIKAAYDRYVDGDMLKAAQMLNNPGLFFGPDGMPMVGGAGGGAAGGPGMAAATPATGATRAGGPPVNASRVSAQSAAARK